MPNILAHFKKVRIFIFDLDGVLTDGNLLVLENGLLARQMNIRDSFAMQLALQKGYQVLVIAGAVSEPVKERLERLGITRVVMPVEDKTGFILDYIKEQRCAPEEILYMADDLPDMDAMKEVGLSCCPADAAPEIRAIVKYVATLAGGKGCAREVIEKVLRLNHHWSYSSR